MNIGLTEIISLAALVISSLSVLYTKRQSDIAKKNHFNDYRSHLSQHHSTYRKKLIEIQKKHEMDLNELSLTAGKKLINIVNHFDRYDTNCNASRHLRHLLHESSEMVFRTFQGQLGWQTAENISKIIFQTSFIEDELNPTEHIFDQNSFREVINSKYTSNPNAYLEPDLVKDIYFCHLVSELKSRTDKSKLKELMNFLNEETIEFNQLHNTIKCDIFKSANILKELINQGNKEHFQLCESYQLFKEMKKTQTLLNTLAYLNTPNNINTSISGNYYFSISRSIHLCVILHAIECLHSWGWNHE